MFKLESHQRRWRSFLLALCCLVPFSANSSDHSATQILGIWVIEEVADLAPIVGMDDKEVVSLPGQKIRVDRNEILFQKFSCKSPKFFSKRTGKREFFKQYRISPPKFLPPQIEQVTIQCEPPGYIGPFILKDDEMFFVWYGVLLRAKRNVRQVQH